MYLSSRKPDPSVSQRRSAAHARADIESGRYCGAERVWLARLECTRLELAGSTFGVEKTLKLTEFLIRMHSLCNHNIRGWYNDIHIVWGRKLFTISLNKHDNFLHYTTISSIVMEEIVVFVQGNFPAQAYIL